MIVAVERQKRFSLALLFILMGMITLCASGANLIGQAPPKAVAAATAAGETVKATKGGVSPFVLFGASLVSLAIGFLIFFKLQREK